MNLLILTQKVDKDDPILGFFHRWIEEFAKNFQEVIVICLFEGKYDLPSNVRVLSLGKETGRSRFKYISRFFYYIVKERNNYNSVFVHMNQVYAVLGGLFWRLNNKTVSLWYTHRQKSLGLWIAEKLVNNVFTSAPESFTLKSDKIHILGHGIETSRFICQNRTLSTDNALRLISVGRITPIKNIDTLILACKKIKDKGVNFTLKIVGEPAVSTDDLYLKKLKEMVEREGLSKEIVFIGAISNLDLPKYYCQSDILINLTPKGGIDKAVIEGMASGAIPLVSNTAFRLFFGSYGGVLIFTLRDSNDLANKIVDLSKRRDLEAVRASLNSIAKKEFDTTTAISKITKIIKEKQK